jgi:hypothetical protein
LLSFFAQKIQYFFGKCRTDLAILVHKFENCGFAVWGILLVKMNGNILAKHCLLAPFCFPKKLVKSATGKVYQFKLQTKIVFKRTADRGSKKINNR